MRNILFYCGMRIAEYEIRDQEDTDFGMRNIQSDTKKKRNSREN